MDSMDKFFSILNAKVQKVSYTTEYVEEYGLAAVTLFDSNGNKVYFQIKSNGTFGLLTYNDNPVHSWQ